MQTCSSESLIHPGCIAAWKGVLRDALNSKVISFLDKNHFKSFKGHSQGNVLVTLQLSATSKVTKLSFDPMVKGKDVGHHQESHNKASSCCCCRIDIYLIINIKKRPVAKKQKQKQRNPLCFKPTIASSQACRKNTFHWSPYSLQGII